MSPSKNQPFFNGLLRVSLTRSQPTPSNLGTSSIVMVLVSARIKRSNALVCRRRGSVIPNSIRRTSPHDAHPIRGTSTISQTGLKPTGTVRNHRFDTPRWTTLRLRQHGQRTSLLLGAHAGGCFLLRIPAGRSHSQTARTHGTRSSWTWRFILLVFIGVKT